MVNNFLQNFPSKYHENLNLDPSDKCGTKGPLISFVVLLLVCLSLHVFSGLETVTPTCASVQPEPVGVRERKRHGPGHDIPVFDFSYGGLGRLLVRLLTVEVKTKGSVLHR